MQPQHPIMAVPARSPGGIEQLVEPSKCDWSLKPWASVALDATVDAFLLLVFLLGEGQCGAWGREVGGPC
jgi:hypothetical protein